MFVFHDAGGYTGLYAAIDASGWFCIDPIAPGTYHLQVKVDDHEPL